jgi:hypothetical protein
VQTIVTIIESDEYFQVVYVPGRDGRIQDNILIDSAGSACREQFLCANRENKKLKDLADISRN